MEKKAYKIPAVREHDVAADRLLIYVGSDDKTDQQLGKPRSEKAQGEQGMEYGDLW